MDPRRAPLAGLVLLALGAPPAAAQEEPSPDTLPSSEAPPDSLVGVGGVLPIPAPEIPSGPLAPGTRYIFTRDSIAWSSGYTLADLLGEIPGVYVARGGFTGQPEPISYAGRGPTSIEILWDGVPVLPIGPDSVAVDPGRISLFPFRRVDVEQQPGLLRVFLVTERHERATTRSTVRIISGDFETGGYAGLFQHRWRNGVGINLAADFLGTEGAREQPREASWLNLWAKAEWTPTRQTSASIQIRRDDYERDPTAGGTAVEVPERRGLRTDVLMRFTAATRPGRQGAWLEAGLTTTAWSADSGAVDSTVADRTFRRVFLGVGYRDRRATAEARTRIGDHFTPWEADARVGWVPIGGVVVSADGSAARHRKDRTSVRGHVHLGLYGGPLFLVGEAGVQSAVSVPAIAADTAQQVTDLGAKAGLATRWLSGHVGLIRRAGFAPPPFTAYPGITVRPVESTRYLTAAATLRLGAWTLNGWYSNPVSGSAADFQPPTHGRAALTFRSRFIRTFRSGAFDLKVQVAMESWSRGVAGTDGQGAEIPLIGATFYEGFVQFQIAGFQAFYSLKNAYNSREQFVPGLEYPRNIQTFGVKWVFTN